MEINRSLYKEGQFDHLSDDIDFSKEELNENLIRKINSCHVEIDVSHLGEIFRVKAKVEANVVLVCAYTLEDVPYVLKGEEEFDFVDDPNLASDELFYEEKNIIKLDKYIFSLLIALIPPKVIKKGAKLPKNGNGYRVLTEDEYLKEKSERVDPRWAALDNFKFDDED